MGLVPGISCISMSASILTSNSIVSRALSVPDFNPEFCTGVSEMHFRIPLCFSSVFRRKRGRELVNTT